MGHDDCLARTQEEPPGITQRELSEHLLSILYPQAVSILQKLLSTLCSPLIL